MIFRCKCGAFKTGQPWRSSGTAPWLCEKCAPGKRSQEAMRGAREANGGKYHAFSEPARAVAEPTLVEEKA